MNPVLRTYIVAAVTGLLALGAGTAQAACDLRIKDLTSGTFHGHDGRGYEVFDRDQHSEVVEFTIERKKGACSFRIGFSAGRSGNVNNRQLSSSGNILNYQLYRTVSATTILKDIPLANDDEMLTGTLSATQDSVKFRAVFLIPFLQIVRPGTYRDTIIVRVYEGTLQTPQLRDQAQLPLSATVPATAEFCLGNTVVFEAGYRNACLDFGELKTGATGDLMMHARSNAGYRITMRSQNSGTMRVLDPKDTSAIPYSLQLDGRGIPLAGKSPVLAAEATGLTSAFGTSHKLRFIIGKVEGASAGAYKDVIEVTLYPNR